MTTDESRAELRKHMSMAVDAMVKWKSLMKKAGLKRAQATCPSCNSKNSVLVTINGTRKHLHAACRAEGCNWKVME